MTKILYIGAFPPASLIENSNGAIDSLYRSSEAQIAGFRQIKDVDISVITSPDIASFPKQKLFFKGFYDVKSDVYMVSSLNLPFIKQAWTILSMFIKARKIIREYHSNDIVVLLPYMVFRHTSVGRLLQLTFQKKIKVGIVVPDIFFSKNRWRNYYYKIAERQASNFDLFILYTKAMAKYLDIENKPNVVIEGYYEVCPKTITEFRDKFVVTYTGSLNVRYGITRLVDSMAFIPNPDIELHLYGDGDGVDYIRQHAIDDQRIKFKGKVPKQVATEALYKSSVLINPRNSTDGDYVQYSFPSKDIDYLATGVISILCKLPGMPEEYYEHFIDAGNGSPQELSRSILKAYELPAEERKLKALTAQRFIVDRMDCRKQAEKIINLINNKY